MSFSFTFEKKHIEAMQKATYFSSSAKWGINTECMCPAATVLREEGVEFYLDYRVGGLFLKLPKDKDCAIDLAQYAYNVLGCVALLLGYPNVDIYLSACEHNSEEVKRRIADLVPSSMPVKITVSTEDDRGNDDGNTF